MTNGTFPKESRAKKALKKFKSLFGAGQTPPLPPKSGKSPYSGKYGDPAARKKYLDFAYSELDSLEHRPKKKESLNSNKASR